jgi:hypothetical protein
MTIKIRSTVVKIEPFTKLSMPSQWSLITDELLHSGSRQAVPRLHRCAAGQLVECSFAEWYSRELAAGFTRAVVAAVRQAHPGDLDTNQ